MGKKRRKKKKSGPSKYQQKQQAKIKYSHEPIRYISDDIIEDILNNGTIFWTMANDAIYIQD